MTSAALPDVSVEELELQGEPIGERFLIRTTLQDTAAVRQRISHTLGDRLIHSHMTWSVAEYVGNRPATTGPTEAPVQPTPDLANPVEKTTGTAGAEKAVADGAEQMAGSAAILRQAGAALTAKTFPNGTNVDLRFDEPLSLGSLRADFDSCLLEQGFADPQLHYTLTGATAAEGQSNEYTQMRLATSLDEPSIESVLPAVQKRLAAAPVFERLDNFGSQVAQTAQTSGVEVAPTRRIEIADSGGIDAHAFRSDRFIAIDTRSCPTRAGYHDASPEKGKTPQAITCGAGFPTCRFE